MKTIELKTEIHSYSYNELSETDRRLVDMAREATTRSYSPYSRFSVGAAILLSNGEIITGANQENAAYPSGTCAERTAAFYAHARYPEAKFRTIAIAAVDTTGHETTMPVSPCGACRQSLLEFETLAGKGIKMLLIGATEIYMIDSIKAMLPLAFSEF